jgi:hypothetical protein
MYAQENNVGEENALKTEKNKSCRNLDNWDYYKNKSKVRSSQSFF